MVRIPLAQSQTWHGLLATLQLPRFGTTLPAMRNGLQIPCNDTAEQLGGATVEFITKAIDVKVLLILISANTQVIQPIHVTYVPCKLEQCRIGWSGLGIVRHAEVSAPE